MDYIGYWKHNGYWLFDSPDILAEVAKDASGSFEQQMVVARVGVRMVGKVFGRVGLNIGFALLMTACASGRVTETTENLVVPAAVEMTLVCGGSFNAQSYPYGKRPTSQATVYVVTNADPRLTQAGLSTSGEPQVICKPPIYEVDECTAGQDAQSLNVSSYWSGVVTTLTLDKRTGTLRLGSGGMDGGWNFQGICKPLKSRRG